MVLEASSVVSEPAIRNVRLSEPARGHPSATDRPIGRFFPIRSPGAGLQRPRRSTGNHRDQAKSNIAQIRFWVAKTVFRWQPLHHPTHNTLWISQVNERSRCICDRHPNPPESLVQFRPRATTEGDDRGSCFESDQCNKTQPTKLRSFR